mgnify:FL=1
MCPGVVRRDARGEARDGAASAPTAHRVPGIPPRSSPCRPLCAVRPCRRWCVSSSDSWCVAVCELSHRRRAIRDVPARSSTRLRARSIIKVHYLLDVQPGRILYCRTKVLIRLLALSEANDCLNSFVRQHTTIGYRHVGIANSITRDGNTRITRSGTVDDRTAPRRLSAHIRPIARESGRSATGTARRGPTGRRSAGRR